MTLPVRLTPLNLKAYFFAAFNACGCSEMAEMYGTVLRLLQWHDGDIWGKLAYDMLYTETGVFYLLVGLLEQNGLVEHGVSVRCGWLTEDGERLLAAMQEHSPEDVEGATGEAYDGSWYD